MRRTSYLNLELQEDKDFYNIEALNDIFLKLEAETKRLSSKDTSIENSLLQNTPSRAKKLDDYVNLNNLSDGFYYSGNSAQVNTYTNCPTQKEFSLIQINNRQMLMSAEFAYFRKKDSDWYRLLTNTDLDTVNNRVNSKVDKVPNKTLTDNNYTTTEKNKLEGIESGANKYTHPATHSANIITETTDKRFMTDAERTKLSGIEAGATKYNHPATHSANIITETTDRRFVKDTEKAAWDKSTEQIRIIESLSTPLQNFISNNNANGFAYKCFIPIADVTNGDVVNVNFIPASAVRAQEHGVSSFTVTHDNGVEIYCKTIPSTALVFDAVIKRSGK